MTLVRILASAVLARRLEPADFGVFGLAFLFYELSERLSMSGMAGGLIAKKDVRQRELSTCFWLACASRGLLGGVLAGAAHVIAAVVGKAEVGGVIRVVGILLAVSGLGVVPSGLLRKRLQFREVAVFRMVRGLTESGTAVVLAVWTALGYWALVAGLVLGVITEMALVFVKARWRPTVEFDGASARFMMRYGVSGTLSSILGYLSHNIDYLIVAKLLGVRALGLYEFAFRIPHMISERISSPMGVVLFPTLSAGKQDDHWLRESYLRVTRYLAWIVFPCFAGLAVTAPVVVKVLWGQKWIVIVPSLRILCISAALGCFWWTHNGLFLVKKKPELGAKLSLVALIVSMVSIYLGGVWWGMVGVAAGMSFAKAVSILGAYLAMRLVSGSLVQWFKSLVRPFAASLIMMCVVLVVKLYAEGYGLSGYVLLPMLVVIGVVVYVFLAYVLYNDDFNEVLTVVKLSGARL